MKRISRENSGYYNIISLTPFLFGIRLGYGFYEFPEEDIDI
ncbi:hypothetical protein BH10ACI3_BH10ACI3_03650 [soil metagenome]